MDVHVRQFAILTIIFSAAAFFLGTGVLVYVDGPGNLLHQSDVTGFGPALSVLVVWNIVLAVPSTACAYFLMQYREWARSAMIVISALNILNVPFGSLLGAYGLWVLMTQETEPLFEDRLLHTKSRTIGHVPAHPEAKSKRAVPRKADL